MISLTIHHNIHLTKNQRYQIHEGLDTEVVGVSVPVWFMNKTTSEPAKEVFCKYYLRNPGKDMPIRILDDGYEITMPCRRGNQLEISDEEWRFLNITDPYKLDDMYKKTTAEITSKHLLDVNDGGSGSLVYREHNKIKKNGQLLNIMHFICINSVEHLTLTNLDNQ